MKIVFFVNEIRYELDVDADMRLLDILRDTLGLTGTKCGCGEGECGACTVVMDGKAVNSCLILAGKANGHHFVTVEGLERNGELHPIQRAFLECGAFQCGFCTPGMLMSSYALLTKNLHPGDEEIKKALSGNLCRCTGYQKIIEAVKLAAKLMAEEKQDG